MMLSDGIIGEKQDLLIHKFAIGLGYSEERTEVLYSKTIDFVLEVSLPSENVPALPSR